MKCRSSITFNPGDPMCSVRTTALILMCSIIRLYKSVSARPPLIDPAK